MALLDAPITGFTAHPIAAGLASTSFRGGLFVDFMDDGVGARPGDHDAAARDRQSGAGPGRPHIRVADEWISFHSERENMPEIQRFWVQTPAYPGPPGSCTVSRWARAPSRPRL